MNETTLIQPQPGAQYAFVQSSADIAIMGGAAGGGKTYGLLLQPLRFFNEANINAAMFRRKREQLSLPGSLWTESQKLYTALGLRPNLTRLEYRFKSNSYLKFSGLQYDNDVMNWQGPQLDFLGLDELTHFSEYQFWYLIGRLRSVSGRIKPYCRATCNPDPGWVFDLLKWWIDEKTGLPILERSGKLRWLCRINDLHNWFDTEELAMKFIKLSNLEGKILPISITFIPATLNDNQILLKNDPTYYARLAQLPEAERIQLLEGRWFFRPAGNLFKPDWFRLFVVPPADPDVLLITTDTASSTKTANDFTCFQIWIRREWKVYFIEEIWGKFTAQQQLTLLVNVIMKHKAPYVSIERASTGFHLIDEIVKKTGVIVLEMTRSKDKYTRGFEVQKYVENGYVFINPNAPYYTGFISEVAAFSPENKNKSQIKDDRVDCFIDAVYHLLINKIMAKQTKSVIETVPIDRVWAKGT